MESLQSAKRSVSREGLTRGCSTRSCTVGDVAATRSTGSLRGDLNENRTPPSLPKGFESMLKTATETGDIGPFSIRPSHVPPPLNTPRRTGGTWDTNGLPKKPQRQSFRPHGVPITGGDRDDRRRLPSYTKNASSELISMYETVSQKPPKSRAFEDHDCRSFSMTQTSSYTSYTLSNQKSYSSLRSQAEGGVQRPRSPFAYPTRLKRPGFRPSSPALTDGGAVDYSRRAEIKRNPLYMSSINTSSPASLYAQKRVPAPLLIRTDANRSNPSLLSQISPPRRSNSPLERTVTPGNDWTRGHVPTPNNESPARSIYSLASTINFYQYASAPSTSTTPGKVPPSPLYYDYTEEFDIDEYNGTRSAEPPPALRFEKTIPEDRPLSAERPSVDSYAAPPEKQNLGTRLGLTPSPASFFFPSSDNTPPRALSKSGTREDEREKNQGPAFQAEPFNLTLDGNGERTSEEILEITAMGGASHVNLVEAQKPKDVPVSSKIIAQRLSDQAKKAFGLPSSSSDESVSLMNRRGEHKDSEYSKEDLGNPTHSNTRPATPARTSSFMLTKPLPIFPTPPGHRFSEHAVDEDLTSQKGVIFNEGLIPVPINSQIARIPIKASSYAAQKSTTSDGEPACEERDCLRRSSESTRQIIETPRRAAMLSSPIPEEPVCSQPSEQTIISSLTAAIQIHSHNGSRRRETATFPSDVEKDYLNFGPQIPKRTVSRSDSPILAPKPISPARQLKLKNSVPQLMKALPPLPPDLLLRAASPAKKFDATRKELHCQFSLLLSGTPPVQQQIQKLRPSESDQPGNGRGKKKYNDIELTKGPLPVELNSGPIRAVPNQQNLVETVTTTNLTTSPPKLKLKIRSPSTLRPTSPPDTRPWNLEESYPWAKQPNIRLPSLIPDSPRRSTKPPKFKLKITRASNSTLGTVRINRDSIDLGLANSLDFQSPRDLFTPAASGIDNIFRKVSKNLKPRRPSLASTQSAGERMLPVVSAPTESQRRPNHPPSLNLRAPIEPGKAAPASLFPQLSSPTDVRSFFSDDSSHHQGGHSLRKRLSNFRARIPYTSRSASQSYDDIVFRERHAAETLVASISNINVNATRTDIEREGRFENRVQTRKFKARVSEWFKGAASAIKARVKLQSQTSGKSGSD